METGRLALAAAISFCFACSSDAKQAGGEEGDDERPPNILFITIDDVGVDQLRSFGYGGSPPAETVSLDALAAGGVRFRNTWSMPTCSPTRTSIFSGQYPFRTGVLNAITSNDLAQSQLSPYTVTTPKLLRQKGYRSALIGKMHLGGSRLGPTNHPLGDEAMRELGWDYFAGYHDGGPYPIDSTAGGVAAPGTYPCGFVPTREADADHGADEGVCYLPGGEQLILARPDVSTPGRSCVEGGGIFDPGAEAPSEERRVQLDFDKQNGYYVGAWVLNHEDGSNELLPPSDPQSRGYRISLETDRAIEWIERSRQEKPEQPWMLSIGYSSLHTPLQPPPAALLPHPDATLSLIGCGSPLADRLAEHGGPGGVQSLADFVQARAVAQHMLEAMDQEIGRLLVAAGVLQRGEDGSVRSNPASDTVVVLVGDNGTYAPSVKLPFDFKRAKGSPYQTGVWVPLLVAGPVVQAPDRDVEAMVNTTDLYRLFAEIAGIDLEVLAQEAPLDAEALLPYLEEADHPSIRRSNFTEVGMNRTATPPPPCVIPAVNVCIQIFPQREICEDQGGDWFGPGSQAQASGFASCCEVNAYLQEQEREPVDVFPRSQRALRNEQYKLVRIERLDCESGELRSVDELYFINQSREASELLLDREDEDLLAGRPPETLSSEERQAYESLVNELEALLASQRPCPGDGNGDGKVDELDLEEWERWSRRVDGGSSWYDLNLDGRTDLSDRAIIEAALGTSCGG